MSEYVVKSKLEDKEWQIANQVRDHVFAWFSTLKFLTSS